MYSSNKKSFLSAKELLCLFMIYTNNLTGIASSFNLPARNLRNQKFLPTLVTVYELVT